MRQGSQRNVIVDWFPRLIWEYLCQPLFPESQILCAENKHKRSLSDWLVEIVIFKQKKNSNMAVYSFFLTFPSFTQWYSYEVLVILGSFETVFRIL